MKTLKIATLFFLILMTSKTQAGSFSHLKAFTIVGKIKIHYNPKNSKTLMATATTYLDEGAHNVLETVLDLKSPQIKYIIQYDPGPSEDPLFIINKKTPDGSLKKIGEILGTSLYIPGNGSVYSQGHTNNMFDTKKKFTLVGEKLAEVKQPFYYVGLTTKTLKNLTLYKSPQLQKQVARLPKNSEITVLLNIPPAGGYAAEELYLVKTPFGLLGWVKVKVSQSDGQNLDQADGTGIKGLFYAGD